AERQALAMMDHPHIARVLDAGETDSGRPYFVMEVVEGKPITDYCDEHRLSVRERLELFIKVCHAVHHSHQKGIIHRDLKPSNVLVVEQHGTAVPKVIDFGLVKALEEPLHDASITRIGQVLGTPQYMSPEQAGKNQTVDTRSDIYSLGVMLFELLTGATPLTRERLNAVNAWETWNLIVQTPNPRPSSRLRDTSVGLRTVAENRMCPAPQLRKQLAGDLDIVILKSIEKEQERRYESVYSFAADIERYLARKPIEAHPPSLAYRLRKMIQRNRMAASLMGLIGLLLTGSLAGALYSSSYFRQQEQKQRTLADQNADLAQTAWEERNIAVRNRYHADMRVAYNDFTAGQIVRLYDLLRRYLPDENTGQDLRGWEWYYLLGQCRQEERTLRRHTDMINSLAWSPDGQRLASASRDRVVMTDIATGRDIWRLDRPRIGKAMAWSTDGSRLVHSSARRHLQIRDARNGALIESTLGRVARPGIMTWSPEDDRIALLENNSLLLLDLETSRIRKLGEQSGAGRGLAWIHGGRQLVAGLREVDLPSGHDRRFKGNRKQVGPTALSPDGQLIALGHPAPRLELIERTSGEVLRSLPLPSGITAIDWSPDGERLAVGLNDFSLQIFATRKLRRTHRYLGHISPINRIVWSPDGQRIASGSLRHVIKVWPANPRRQLREQWSDFSTISSRSTPTKDLEFMDVPSRQSLSPDGQWIAASASVPAGSAFGPPIKVGLWNAADGSFLSAMHGHVPFARVRPARWTSDSNRFVTGGDDRTLFLWNRETGLLTRRLEGHVRAIKAYEISPDDSRLASRDEHGQLKLWDLESGEEMMTIKLPIPSSSPGYLAWSPDGKTLLGRVDRGEIWDATRGYEAAQSPGLMRDLMDARHNTYNTTMIRKAPFESFLQDLIAGL
ncbi:MAG: serine/threonine-protein kinase, partial [Verrucomicrobiota bacterium]